MGAMLPHTASPEVSTAILLIVPFLYVVLLGSLRTEIMGRERVEQFGAPLRLGHQLGQI
jgi:hypothetical protein